MLLSRFPYVALLSMSPDNRVANAACGSGPDVATPEQLLTLLGLAVAEHGVMLAAQRAEVEERVGDAEVLRVCRWQCGRIRTRLIDDVWSVSGERGWAVGVLAVQRAVLRERVGRTEVR